MKLTSISTIKELLKKYKISPSKRLGQNFLINKNVLQKIIQAGELKTDDVVLEIGPGIGTLTQELAKRVKKVVAIEKDKKLCELLNETFSNLKNVQIIKADIRNYSIPFKNYKVVSNIPYYLTSFLIRKMLEYKKTPSLIVLLIQREVAQRICAQPPKMNLLAVSVQFYAEPKIISYISKNSFWPVPKVDSAIIKIKPKIFRENIDPKLFFKIVKAGFSHPRKQLANNLSKELKLNKERVIELLRKARIEPTKRPENISIKEWCNITKQKFLKETSF